jgi:hypothetical protein
MAPTFIVSFSSWEFGGAEGTRTPDPLHAKQVLSQLSYSPRSDHSQLAEVFSMCVIITTPNGLPHPSNAILR